MSEQTSPAALAAAPTVLPSVDTAGLGAMIAAVLAIAWSPILVRFSELAPASSAFWRLVFSLPVLFIWAQAARPRRASRAGAGFWVGAGALSAAIAGVAFAADLAFYHAALPLTSIANASLISNLAPVASVVAGFVFLGDRLRPLVIVALIVAILGVFVTSGAYSTGFVPGKGDMFATAAGLSYAFYLIAMRVSRGARTAADVTLISTLVAAIVLLVIAVVEGGNFLPHSPRGWAVVIGLGLICQVLGQGLSAVGIGRLPAGIVATILLSHPIISAMIAWFVFGEALGPDQFVGGALILGAVILARINPK